MIALLLAATHLAAAALGGFVTLSLVRHAGHPYRPTHDGRPHVTKPSTPTTAEQRATFWHRRASTYLIVASIVVLVIATQMFLYQQQEDERRERDAARDACVAQFNEDKARWATDLIEVLDARVTANNRLESAANERLDRLDRVVLVVIALRAVPPRATEADFDRALDRYEDALDSYRAQRAETVDTRSENPYPEPPALTC